MADYRALGALRRAPAGDAALEVTCSRDAFGATILVDARAASLLVDPHFAVAEAGAPVWPLFSEGAPPAAVRPGAAWRTTLFSRPRGARVRVSLEAFNLAAPVFVDVACTAP